MHCIYCLLPSTNGNSSDGQYKFVSVTFYIFDLEAEAEAVVLFS